MTTFENAPVLVREKWYKIWWRVLRHPGVETFRLILQKPDTGSRRGFIWIGLTTLISTIITGLLSQSNADPNLSNNLPDFKIRYIVVWPILNIILFAVICFVIRWSAGRFGGNGSWEHLIFTLAAIISPITLIIASLSLLRLLLTGNSYQQAGDVFTIVASLAVIYAFWLSILAIRAVEDIGIGKALLAFIIPFLILFGIHLLPG